MPSDPCDVLLMSVYTIVTSTEIEAFLRYYNVGSLESYAGINEGIENTNYFVDTTLLGSQMLRRYVLTIFEWQHKSDIPYFLELMGYLSKEDVPCPRPIADRQGHYLQTLHGKPATLISRLDGHSVRQAQVQHCEQVGVALAKLHVAVAGFTREHRNKRDWHWCSQCAQKILPFLDASEAVLLREEIQYHQNPTRHTLPRGVIHTDLFMDNVLFDDGRLSGLIDFYYACGEDLIYDLAITVNAWCSDETGTFNEANYLALVKAYAAIRPVLAEEQEAWQDALRRAALRFWLSRLHDTHFQKTGHITHVKDPNLYRDILLRRRHAVPSLC